MSERTRTTLTKRSELILKLIAKGHSYEQVLSMHPGLKYPDIFHAAREALDKAVDVRSGSHGELQAIRQKHPRAYEKWSEEEETELRKLFASGWKVCDIAGKLQRQPGAIQSRLLRMGLTG